MTTDQEPPPGAGQSDHWQRPPQRPASTTVPGWALPILGLGILCSLVVAWISAQYFAGQARGDPPSLSMAYGIEMAPFLIAGLPLLVIGSLGAIRPWSHQRPWLKLVVLAGAVAWLLVCLQGPALVVS